MRNEWHAVYAVGHHGYPQPEDDYQNRVYGDWCARCGLHGRQVAPFRVRRANAAHSHFLQLNWVFDAFFVTPEIGMHILSQNMSGVALGPMLKHTTGLEIAERKQLLITNVLRCVDTVRLPAVTCRPQNEESAFDFGGPKRYSPDTPYCGRVKHHPPTSLAIEPNALSDAPDLVQTAEWFGSGGSAFRLTLASNRFVELVRQMKWRGLEFAPVRTFGYSDRAT